MIFKLSNVWISDEICIVVNPPVVVSGPPYLNICLVQQITPVKWSDLSEGNKCDFSLLQPRSCLCSSTCFEHRKCCAAFRISAYILGFSPALWLWIHSIFPQCTHTWTQPWSASQLPVRGFSLVIAENPPLLALPRIKRGALCIPCSACSVQVFQSIPSPTSIWEGTTHCNSKRLNFNIVVQSEKEAAPAQMSAAHLLRAEPCSPKCVRLLQLQTRSRARI